MKKTVEKFNKIKSWFFEETNKISKIQPGSSRRKRRGHKLIKSEMKKLQLTVQKDKVL